MADPFGQPPASAPAPPVAAQPQVVEAVAPPPPPPPPPPPRPLYGVVGRLATPDGVDLIFLARADRSGFSVVAQPGLTLDDGFTVQSVSEAGVRLQSRATGDQVTLPVPAAGP